MISATKYFSKYIINDIISYVPIIETRMNFNVYNKINLNKYSKLNTVLRNKPQCNCGSYTRYYCCENVDKKYNIEHELDPLNDFIDVSCKTKEDGKVYIEIQIWKLKYKNENNKSVYKNENVYYTGKFEKDYCWDDTTIKYCIE